MQHVHASLAYVCLGVLNVLLVGAGMVVFAVGPFASPDRSYAIDRAAYQAFYETKARMQLVHQGVPTRLQLPALGLDLPIAGGSYDASTNQWTLDNQQAFYALVTPPANSAAGNTLVYGHNIPEVFAGLHQLQPGMELMLYTDKGQTFNYVFRASQDVQPGDVHLLKPSPTKPLLTLQTCTGNWNELRRLFEFELTSVEPLHD